MGSRDSRPRPTVRMARTPINPATPVAVLLVLFFLLLVASISGALLGAWQAWRSASYREVQGVILETEVSRSENRSGKSRGSQSASRYLHVRYRYEVDGVAYEGNRLQPGTFGMTSADSLKRFGALFDEGKSVPVYVDPDDPQTAVLVRGWSSVTTLLCVLSGFFGVAVMILRPLRRALAKPVTEPPR